MKTTIYSKKKEVRVNETHLPDHEEITNRVGEYIWDLDRVRPRARLESELGKEAVDALEHIAAIAKYQLAYENAEYEMECA